MNAWSIGATVIESALLPIGKIYKTNNSKFKIINKNICLGQLSEEAQEARNKDYKNYREHHSRKISRLAQNEDVLHFLLLSSDPYISSIRNTPKKKRKMLLDSEVRALLNVENMEDEENYEI